MGFKFSDLTVTGRQERVWVNVGPICIAYSFVSAFVFVLTIHLYLCLYWLFIVTLSADDPINSARRHRPLSIQPPHRITISIKDRPIWGSIDSKRNSHWIAWPESQYEDRLNLKEIHTFQAPHSRITTSIRGRPRKLTWKEILVKFSFCPRDLTFSWPSDSPSWLFALLKRQKETNATDLSLK